jgi:RES domain-containing protein
MGYEQSSIPARRFALRQRRLSITVFRIGLSLASTVAGQAYGSTLAAGRWHSLATRSRPRRVIYAASTRALAQLEKRVHANGISPAEQALFKLVLPKGLVVSTAKAMGLPNHWRESESTTQAFGNQWLDAGTQLALCIPSYVEPAEYNLLINALHPQLSEIKLVKERDPFEFDPRLA